MRYVLMFLMMITTTQTYAATALECKEGKKKLGFFIQATPTIPMPKRFIFDPENERFFPQTGEWVTMFTQFSEAEVTASFYRFHETNNSDPEHKRKFRDIISFMFDRFTGKFSIDAKTFRKRLGDTEWFLEISDYNLQGYCTKIETKF